MIICCCLSFIVYFEWYDFRKSNSSNGSFIGREKRHDRAFTKIVDCKHQLLISLTKTLFFFRNSYENLYVNLYSRKLNEQERQRPKPDKDIKCMVVMVQYTTIVVQIRTKNKNKKKTKMSTDFNSVDNYYIITQRIRFDSCFGCFFFWFILECTVNRFQSNDIKLFCVYEYL